MKAVKAIGRQLKEMAGKPNTPALWVIGTNLAIIQSSLTNLPRAVEAEHKFYVRHFTSSRPAGRRIVIAAILAHHGASESSSYGTVGFTSALAGSLRRRRS
jgi:hypothetical protein